MAGNDFLSTYTPLANDIATQTGLDPSVVLGIIDTETGGGVHVKGNNIFGISPGGQVAGYPDVQTAARAFVNLMQTPRYRGVAAAGDPASQAVALVRGGYNTASPQYASIVASKALNFGKQLGYQDQGGGQSGPGVYSTSSQPAPDYSDKPSSAPAASPAAPAASAPDYNITPPAGAPAAPTQPPASGSAKDRVLADPALSGGSPSAPAAPAQPSGSATAPPQSAKDRVLADPALQAPPAEKTTQAAPDQPPPGGPPADERPGQYSGAGSASAAERGIPGVPGSYEKPSGAPPPQPEPNALDASASRLGSAVASGWKSSVLAPGAEAAVESVPYVGTPIGYLSRGLGAAVSGAGQAFQEAQRGVSSIGSLLDPRLGRDLALGLEAVPVFTALPEVNALRLPVSAQLAETRAANAAPLSPGFRTAPIAPEASARIAGREPGATEPSGVTGTPPPNPNVPVSVSAVPEPQSVGAAASRDQNITGAGQPTRGAVIRNLENAVNQSAEDRLNPQGIDNTAYVQNIPPRMLASRDFSTTQNALDEKIARADPTVRDQFVKNDRDRNTGMIDLIRGDAGDGISMENAREARRAVSPGNFGAFEGEKPVDASGLLKVVDDALNSPSAKRGAIKSALQDVRDSLFDKDGNLETMPSRLYGARQNLTDLLDRSKGVGDEAKKLQAATSILSDMVPTFDETIGSGAPKYGAYMDEYRRLSEPINQQEFLQKYTEGTSGKKLWNQNGDLLFNRVQGMLNDILQGQKKRGPDQAKSLTNDQVQNIINVRNELAADALRDKHASVKGSDTFQQLKRAAAPSGPLRTAVRETAGLGANALMYHLAQTPELNLLMAGIQHGVAPVVRATRQASKAVKAEELAAARRQELLTPGPPHPLSQY